MKRALIAIGLGLLLSLAWNAASLLVLLHVDTGSHFGKGLEYALFGPGILFAGRGFEQQSAVLPLNEVVFFVIFSLLVFVLQLQISRKK
jgi:hypothetical protein